MSRILRKTANDNQYDMKKKVFLLLVLWGVIAVGSRAQTSLPHVTGGVDASFCKKSDRFTLNTNNPETH